MAIGRRLRSAARRVSRSAPSDPGSSTLSEYLSHFGGRWHLVEKAQRLQWPQPRCLSATPIDVFAKRLPLTTLDMGVLELEDGCVDTKGWVFGKDSILLPQLSWYGGPTRRAPRSGPTQTRHLSGTTLALVSNWCNENYAHYLLDGLGRLALFERAGFSVSEVDHVYCPSPPKPNAASVLDLLGIPSDKRVEARPEFGVTTDCLVVPSCPSGSLAYRPWLVDFLRSKMTAPQPGRNLYVSRRGASRQATNEPQLQALLSQYGFEVYEPADHPNQPADFAGAAVVVGAHGAGLANIVFCRHKTTLLEIVPTDNAWPMYYSLAVAGDLHYAYLVGESSAHRPPDAFGPSPYDYVVDLAEVDEALATVLG